jgi:putative phage-type endonuclease
MIQGSAEWKMARCGSLGASRVADATARIKTGWGASRENIMAELLTERLTGVPTEGFTSEAMRWGTEHEPEARIAYEFRMDASVAEIGIVPHPEIRWTHASPDGLVGDDGLLEIKCPNSATHIDTLLNDTVPGKYIKQMQWQMACCRRAWCDFVSYDPRLPEAMRYYRRRVERDDKAIAAMEKLVAEFLDELAAKEAALRARYEMAEAA